MRVVPVAASIMVALTSPGIAQSAVDAVAYLEWRIPASRAGKVERTPKSVKFDWSPNAPVIATETSPCNFSIETNYSSGRTWKGTYDFNDAAWDDVKSGKKDYLPVIIVPGVKMCITKLPEADFSGLHSEIKTLRCTNSSYFFVEKKTQTAVDILKKYCPRRAF